MGLTNTITSCYRACKNLFTNAPLRHTTTPEGFIKATKASEVKICPDFKGEVGDVVTFSKAAKKEVEVVANEASETVKKATGQAKNLAEELMGVSNFESFKNLKMVNGMSFDDVLDCFYIINKPSNKNVFLATLTDCKAGAILDYREPMVALQKLKQNVVDFVVVPKEKCKADLCYMLNRKMLLSTIENNKEIYTLGLGLDKNTSVHNIYTRFLEVIKKGELPADLEGISIGFPKYNSMIYNMEELNNLYYLRTTPNKLIDKLLKVLHGPSSPYKNISSSEFIRIENAVKNITDEHLIDIEKRGSFDNGLYQFIQYTNEEKELARVESLTKNFYKNFGSIIN